MLVASEREADFCPYVTRPCMRTCTDIRAYRLALLFSWRFWIKPSRWPNNFHSVKSIYAERSEYFGNELKSGRRCPRSTLCSGISLSLSLSCITGHRNTSIRAGIEVRVVYVIRRCNHGRKISDVRRKLDGAASLFKNHGSTVAHRRPRCAITGLRAAAQEYPLSRNSGHFCSVERSKICMRSGLAVEFRFCRLCKLLNPEYQSLTFGVYEYCIIYCIEYCTSLKS